MTAITAVGGGLAGLVSAISCAEAGHDVRLYEAHHQLGGRARGRQGEFLANFRPHVLYDNVGLWPWLAARGLGGGAIARGAGPEGQERAAWGQDLCGQEVTRLSRREGSGPVEGGQIPRKEGA